MMVRRLVVTIVCESDAGLRDLKERGFWDHCRSEHFRILEVGAHEVPRRPKVAPCVAPVPVPA